MKKKISQILILMSIAGIAMLFVIGVKLSKKSMFELIKERRVQNDELVVNLELNDMVPGADAYMHRYTFPVRTEDEGKCIFLYAEAWDEEGNSLQTVIDDTKKNECVEVNFDEEVEILVYSDREYYEGTIRFTNLPVVSLNSYDEWINEEYRNRVHYYADTYVIDPYYKKENKEEYYTVSKSEFFKRGSTAYKLPKTAYKLNIKKPRKKGLENRSVSLLGMRDDDDWVLDAAYVDPSRIRNKLASDIWNLIVQTSNSNNEYILQGEFVELYIDQRFQGLYVLKEPVDKKTIHAQASDYLVKAAYNQDNVFGIVGTIGITDTSDWGGYQLTYPKVTNYSRIWESLEETYRKINELKSESIDAYRELIDLDNIIDYYILLLVTGANDNYGKNINIVNNLEKPQISIVPWDLDMSFGLYYNAEAERMSEKKMHIIDQIDSFYPVSILTKNCEQEFFDLVRYRWIELREDVLNNQNINGLINSYIDKLDAGNVLQKEATRWNENDICFEIEEIRSWINERLKVIDDLYGY